MHVARLGWHVFGGLKVGNEVKDMTCFPAARNECTAAMLGGHLPKYT